MKLSRAVCVLVVLAVPALGESFYLQLHRTGKMYGPYTYAEQAQVGEGKNTYALLDAGLSFRLKAQGDGSIVGPFPFEDGALIELAGASFILVKQPTALSGVLKVSGFNPDRVAVHVLRVGPSFPRELAVLQRVFAVLQTKHEHATAPIQTAPRVSGSMPGFRRDGMAERSEKDVAKSRDSRDRQARRALEKFIPYHKLETLQVGGDGAFGLANIAPGDYVLYSEAKKRAALGQGKLFEEYFWWQPFHVTRGEAADVPCSRENAHTWEELFEMIRTGALLR